MGAVFPHLAAQMPQILAHSAHDRAGVLSEPRATKRAVMARSAQSRSKAD
jgi:hypothetical protein